MVAFWGNRTKHRTAPTETRSTAMDTMTTIPKLYTVEEAATLSRRSERALYQLRGKGRGPKFKNIDGRLLVSEADLADWLNGSA